MEGISQDTTDFIQNISGAFLTQIVCRISPQTVEGFPVVLAPKTRTTQIYMIKTHPPKKQFYAIDQLHALLQVDGPLGKPPYEKPSIAKGVTNFVLHRFSNLSPKDWHMMYDLAKVRVILTIGLI